MQCSKPGIIRSEELLAYLAGEKVRPAVKEHLASCQYCSSQLAAYRRMERTLIKKLYRWDCPPNQTLGEYQLGLLSNEQAAPVREHLKHCVLCATEVAALNEFLEEEPVLVEHVAAASQSVPALATTQNNHHPVQNAPRVLDSLHERAGAGLRRIVARLLPPQPQLALGVRGSQAVWPRRYAAEDVSIDVQLERAANPKDSLQLIGLVTRKGMTVKALQGTAVHLSLHAQTVYTQTIDELGNFVFAPIIPATYTLEVLFPDGIVVIEQLPVTA